MEAWFLREWQRESPWQILLRPLSWLFAVLAAARRMLFRSGLLPVTRVPVPVIVVGNITVGGTGKTPLVLAIVQLLAQAGYRCGVVMRGYAGDDAARGRAAFVRVLPPAAGGDFVSDEASLLASRTDAPVFAAVRRAEAARALLAACPATNVIVCDDGLQHYWLHRDVEICVTDGARGLGNGHLLPAGPLREPASRLRRVDAVVVNRTAGHAGGTSIDTTTLPVASFSMVLEHESFVSLTGGEELAIDAALGRFAGKRIAAIAGIGNPSRFFAHLGRLGVRVSDCRAFPDHHRFVIGDVPGGEADIVLMTEKDAVKCRAFADARMWYMRVDATLPAAFGEYLLNRLAEVKMHHVARSQTA